MNYYNRDSDIQCPQCQRWQCKKNGIHTTKTGKVQRIYCKLCMTNVDQFLVKQDKRKYERFLR